MDIITRSNNQDKLIIQSKKGLMTVSKKDFLDNIAVDKLIRLRLEEHACINLETKYFTHFNLQQVNHSVGEMVALPLIVVPGYYSAAKEVLPVLSFEGCYVGQCIGVKNNVAYDELVESDFTNSFPFIKNISQLKKAILVRYRQSVPGLSDEEILLMGVAITQIQIIGTLEEYLRGVGKGSVQECLGGCT